MTISIVEHEFWCNLVRNGEPCSCEANKEARYQRSRALIVCYPDHLDVYYDKLGIDLQVVDALQLPEALQTHTGSQIAAEKLQERDLEDQVRYTHKHLLRGSCLRQHYPVNDIYEQLAINALKTEYRRAKR